MIFILAVALTGGSILTEKGEGTIERCLVAGVTMFEILLSHIITEFVIMVGQTGIVLGFAFIIFDVQNVGPWLWVILLSLLQGVNGMSLGNYQHIIHIYSYQLLKTPISHFKVSSFPPFSIHK